jgi:hypothetical protein
MLDYSIFILSSAFRIHVTGVLGVLVAFFESLFRFQNYIRQLKKGNVYFVKINNNPTNVHINGQELHITLPTICISKISIGHPFGANTRDINLKLK